MIVRPLDENGDMIPIHSVDQMISGTDAVAQVIHLRMDLMYGEWWEDETIGFRIPDFLVKGVRSGDIDMLAKYVASYISGTQGVRSVTNVAASYANHTLILRCAVLTDDGTSIVEVDLSGVL